MKTAVVLAGGAGKRLLPITENIPKAMVPVAGKPILEWILRSLKQFGVKRAVVGVAYLKEEIIEHFQDGRRLGLDIVYSEHTVEGGTAEGFRLAISRSVDDPDFIAMNADQLTDLNLARLYEYHREHRPVATLGLTRPALPFGQVEIDEQCNVTSFAEKPLSPFYCSAGVYAFDRSILDYIPRRGDIERTVFPRLAREGRMKGFKHEGFFVTINTFKDLVIAEKELKRLLDSDSQTWNARSSRRSGGKRAESH